MIEQNHISISRIADIGCGAGGVLSELSRLMAPNIKYYGFDISPQAIEIARGHQNDTICFEVEDLLAPDNDDYFDLLLIIDVVEHIADHIDFLMKSKMKALYKIFHIPLDLSISSLMSDSFIEGRRNLGHIHCFSFKSALACLSDTGHIIMDYFLVHPVKAYFVV